MQQNLDFALSLADMADRIALSRFSNKNFTTRTKADGSPVSEVDVQVEARIRQQLSWHRLDDSVLGEEFGETNGTSGRRWIIDPIDGTANFVSDDPNWAFQIGLEIDGDVVLGIVSAPALQTRWWAAQGLGAYKNHVAIRASIQVSLSHATHSQRSSGNAARSGVALSARVAVARGASGPDLYWSELLVASGDVDFDVGGGGHAWDLVPRKAIIVEAGALFTSVQGDAISHGQAVAANPHIHAQIIRSEISEPEATVA